ncbi:MAG TPA: 30S ribosomal protein S14 [Rhodospirillales bacterium]|nr:30S ribosomal protein S14 [Rhodospirillales bacterium]
MAKKSAVEKNKRRRELAAKYREKRAALKAIVKDRTRDPGERFEAVLKLAELPRNSAAVRIRNRCTLSGRPRGYYRRFGLSRIALRELASEGKIPGVVKASW